MTIWYISTTGSDVTGDGTLGNPYATVTKVLSVCSNTDTVRLLSGTYTVTSTTNINKQITITSNTGISSSVILDANCTIYNIQESNINITYMTLQSSSSDALVTIDRMSIGTTVPTFMSGNMINNCNLKYIGTALELNGNFTVTYNTFTRQSGTNVVDLIKLYSTRSTCYISNNTVTDSQPLRHLIYMTATGSGNYFDRCNSKGGTINIATNTVTLSNGSQSTNIVNIDYFNQYSITIDTADIQYNNNTKLKLLINDNNITSNVLGRFINLKILSNNDLSMFGSCNLNNNTMSITDYGLIHLDKIVDSSIVTLNSNDLNRSIFKTYNNQMNTIEPPYNYTSDSTCLLWFDGSDITTMYQDAGATNPITTHGQSMQCWKSKTQSANNATCSNILLTYDNVNTVNGHSVISCADRSEMFFNNPYMLSGAQDCTLIVIHITPVLSGYGNRSVHPFNRRIYNDFAWLDYDSYTYENLGLTQRYQLTYRTGRNIIYVYTLVADHLTNTSVYINRSSTPLFTGTYSANAFSLAQWFGSSTGTGPTDQAGMTGRLCEMILFNRALTNSTTPTLSKIVNQLCDKWGVS